MSSIQCPRISIVTPSYNQAQFLEQTLDSVLSQGYPNLEYIVMDGGSTDGSADIIRRHEKHLSHWQSRRDGGQSAAINAGFKRATGDIFCWINSDDFFKAGALKKAGELLANDSPIWMVGGCELVDVRGRVFDTRLPPHDMKPALLDWWQGWFAQQSTFWTRSMWKAAGPLDERLQYSMDYDLWLRMAAVGPPTIVPDALAGYRFHDEAKCFAGNRGELTRENRRVLSRHLSHTGYSRQEANERRRVWSREHHQQAIEETKNFHFREAWANTAAALRFNPALLWQPGFLSYAWTQLASAIFDPRLKWPRPLSGDARPKAEKAPCIVFSLPGGVEVGGVTTWAFEMAKRIRQRGRQVLLIDHVVGNQASQNLGGDSAYLRRCEGEHPNATVSQHEAVTRYLPVYQACLPCVFVPNWSAGTYAASVLASFTKPDQARILGFAHTDLGHYYLWLNDYLPAVSAFVAVSDEIAQRLIHQTPPYRHADVLTRPYAVNVDAVLTRTWSDGGEPLKLIYAGRFETHQKRVFDFIPLAALLVKQGVNFELTMVGAGQEKEAFQQALALQPAEVRNRVHVREPENPDRMPEMWRRHDVCLLLSAYEGTSIAMLEAMAQGCVPVVTRVSGVQAAVREGVNGFSVAIGDLETMAQRIAEMDADRGRLHAMGTAAHQTILQRYSYDQYVDWFLKLCDDVWNQPTRKWPSWLPLPLIKPETFDPLAEAWRLSFIGKLLGRQYGLRTRLRRAFARRSES